jgi:hypothetical protein
MALAGSVFSVRLCLRKNTYKPNATKASVPMIEPAMAPPSVAGEIHFWSCLASERLVAELISVGAATDVVRASLGAGGAGKCHNS